MGIGGSRGYSAVAVAQWYLEGMRDYGSKGFDRASKTVFRESDMGDMSGKVVVITGANKGIGFASASALAKLNAKVYLVCRDVGRADEARASIVEASGNQNVFARQCDVSLYADVRRFASSFSSEEPVVDVLVNNAGCIPLTRTLTSEGNEALMATTLGGTHLLTDLLVPSLARAKGRVINVASAGGYTVRVNPSDLYGTQCGKYDGTLFYAFAKRAQIILTEMWAERLAGRGVTANSMHPGWAPTEGVLVSIPDFHKQNKDSFRTVEQAADTVVFLASNRDRVSGASGLFWFDRQPVRTHMPWAGTEETQAERRLLWTKSSEAVGGIATE